MRSAQRARRPAVTAGPDAAHAARRGEQLVHHQQRAMHRVRPLCGGAAGAAEAAARERAALDKEATDRAALAELRANLKTGTVVTVQRFGSTGKVVKVDAKKQTVTVSVGIGQWEVPFEEIFPV